MGSQASQASAVAASPVWDVRLARETGVFCQVWVLCASGPLSPPGEAASVFKDSFLSPLFRTSLLMAQLKTFALLTPTWQHRHRAPGRSLSFRDSRFPEPGLGPAVSSEDRGQGPSDCRGSTLWRGGSGCGSLVPAVPSWESSCCSLAALSCSFPIQTIHSQGPSLHRLQGAPPGPHFDCC